jgi:hypothetical protein
MKPPVARGILCLLSILYIPLYLFVLLVALVTGGGELIRQPGAWYAALAPLSYVGFVGAYAFGITKRPISRPIMAALHLAVAPALLFSFVGLGLLLPVFAALFWWVTRRGRVPAVAS